MNPANNYRNGTLYLAYTAAAYKRLFDLADKHGVNLVSMLSWSFEFENRDLFEGFRDLSTNGVDKPILNFFRMAATMRGTRVATHSSAEVPLDSALADGVHNGSDVAEMATRDGHSAGVLVWNYSDEATYPTAANVQLAVHDIPAGEKNVRVTQYRIDDAHSNAYSAWKQMGSPAHPTEAQFQQLKKTDGLQTMGASQRVPVTNDTLSLPVVIPPQSVSLFICEW